MSKHKFVKQKAFQFGWKSVNVRPEVRTDGFFGMRGWQEKAFNLLKNDPYMILNAPMGSGKSWLMCLLSAYKMKKDSKLRSIFAVPQTIIANGFVEANLVLPDGDKLHWLAQHDLCSESPNEGTITYLIKFLEGPHGFFADRVLLCSHATLVAAYNRLKIDGKLDLLKNLMLWIDEAHHVKNAEAVDYEGALLNNGIGEIVAYVLNHNNNVQLGIATASFFRGDRCSLLTESMEKKFTRFNLPYDEYLESMQHLQSFSFDFMLCGPDFTQAINKLLKHRVGKDIIYIPHPSSKHSTGDKYREVEDIIAKYKKTHGGKETDLDNGLTVLRRKDGDFKIMDLVDEDRRNAKDKKHVEVIQLLPFSLDQVEVEGTVKVAS
jgi:hypothetical protein